LGPRDASAAHDDTNHDRFAESCSAKQS
jgi:hypothetical protein